MEKEILSDIPKRAQKLASAVYLITSFFNDLEPVKWKLRALSTDLATLGPSITDTFYNNRHEVKLEVRNIITELRSLLGLAKNAALISDANYSLLEGEMVKYVEELGFPTGIEERSGHVVLSSDFFKIDPSEIRRIESPSRETEANTIKDKTNESEISKRQTANSSELLPPFRKPEQKSLKEFGAVSVKKNSRQSVIIGLLKRKKEIMIKDVSPLISGCSEKTIQRELLSMVKAGILKKEGEKRWSRYSFADEAKS